MDNNANLLNRFQNLIKDGKKFKIFFRHLNIESISFCIFHPILYLATETDPNDRLTQALAAANLRMLAVRPQAVEEALKHPCVKHLLTKAEKEQAEFKSQNGKQSSK